MNKEQKRIAKDKDRHKKAKTRIRAKRRSSRAETKEEKKIAYLQKRERQADGTNQRGVVTGKKQPGRNERCTCGSGLKFKKCCLDKFRPMPTKTPMLMNIQPNELTK